jgi:hypothetical protein
MVDRRVVSSALIALCLAVATAGCGTSKGGASFSGNVDPGPGLSAPATENGTSTTTLTAADLVLAADGLGPLRFGTQAAMALAGLTQALGKAEAPTPVPVGAACGATRVFRWENLSVFVNEVSGRSGSATGLVGWSLAGTAPTALGLTTDKSVGIGSTVKALRTAYGDGLALRAGDHGPAFTITTPTGAITGALDAITDTGKVLTLQAGTVCG